MGGVALGMGLSGVVMNFARIIDIWYGEQKSIDPFISTMVFYGFNTLF